MCIREKERGVKRFDRKRRRNELVVLKDVVCWRVVVKTSSPPDRDEERERMKREGGVCNIHYTSLLRRCHGDAGCSLSLTFVPPLPSWEPLIRFSLSPLYVPSFPVFSSSSTSIALLIAYPFLLPSPSLLFNKVSIVLLSTSLSLCRLYLYIPIRIRLLFPIPPTSIRRISKQLTQLIIFNRARIPHIFSFFKNFFLVSVARKTTAIAAAAPAEARAVLAVPAIPARSRDAVPLSSFHRCRSARAICSSTAKCSRSETAFSVKPPVVKTNQMNFSSSGRELFNNEKKMKKKYVP